MTWVIIDEIQKVPTLLDWVHKLIHERKFQFALTGSSARQLKRGAANMLAGRAFVYHLFPLTVAELQDSFSLPTALQYGTLPKSFEYGQLFEAFIINELYRQLTYAEKQFKLSYLRVGDDQEIDLIIERGRQPLTLIEIKSSSKMDERHATGLRLFERDFPTAQLLLLSNDPQPKQLSRVQALHWTTGIDLILNL